jgi:Flp pilus assembly CpaF family ATPase
MIKYIISLFKLTNASGIKTPIKRLNVGFNKERVTKVIDKISGKVKIKVDEKQPTIDTFFKKKEKKP